MNLIDENLKLKILRGKPLLLEKTKGFFIHRTIGEIIKQVFLWKKYIKVFLMKMEIKKN